MKRVKFCDYIRQLPSNIVLQYLSGGSSSKILTNNKYEKICADFHEKAYVSQILGNLSQEARDEIFQVYLCGDAGKRASSPEVKAEAIKSFLAFEGVDENRDALFGFPDLAHVLAKNFTNNLNFGDTHGSGAHVRPKLFFGALLSDLAVILDMFRNGESKICCNLAYSQRWTELLRERCGIGQLLDSHDELQRILDFTVDFSQFCGAKFERAEGKIVLLSNTGQLLEKIISETKHDPCKAASFSGATDFSFLRALVGEKIAESGENGPQTVKFNENSVKGVSGDLKFSLAFLHWCGLLESSGDFFRIKEREQTAFSKGHILPDFSVYIPVEADPTHINKILYSTKITSVDVIYHGKIDKKRVDEALVNGVDENEIVEILREWNATSSVLKTVEEWAATFKRAFSDLPYIAFRNDVVSSVIGHAQLKEKLTPVDGYTFFKVKSGQEESALAILEKIGFDLRKTGEKNALDLQGDATPDDDSCRYNKSPASFARMQEYILVSG